MKDLEAQIIQFIDRSEHLQVKNLPVEICRLLLLDDPLKKDTKSTHIRSFFIPALKNPESAETILFLHGFGGSALTHHRHACELAKTHNTYFFDWLGMGCSGRPDIKYEYLNARQVIEMFVECLRQVIKELGLQKIHLEGHSLGAYIGFQYIHKYPENVLSFSAISAAGTTTEPDDFADILKSKKLPLKRRAFKHFWLFMNKGYVRGRFVFNLAPLEWIITGWTKGRVEFEGKEKEVVVKYLVEMFRSEGFSCEILPHLFGYRAYAYIPVTDIIEEVHAKVPVMHVFGDTDWMDKFTFQKYLKESRKTLTQTKLTIE